MKALKYIKLSVVGAVLPIVTVALLMGVPLQAASAATTSQACSNSNSVIPGGVSGAADLKQTYAQNPCGDVQQLYNYFGITSASQFTGMVVGHVDDSNNVYVDTKGDTVHTLVATNAITAGRDNISNSNGSSIAILGGKFYKRPPAVSFASGTLNALIKLDGNNEFMFAVITSCGNPVIGKHVTPKPQPAPQPKPTPTPTTTNTTVKVVNNNVNNNTNTITTAAPASQQQPTQLPDTGAGSLTGLFATVSSLGFLGHRLYLRRRLVK